MELIAEKTESGILLHKAVDVTDQERNPYEVYEKATIAFQKLKAQKGDIVVVNFPSNINRDQMAATAEMLGERSRELGVHILCTTAGITIEDLPEETLNKLGYFKRTNEV